MSLPRPLPPFALLSLLISVAFAHPDYRATQPTQIEIVAATQPPSGDARVTTTTEGERRIITANGLPDHATGAFPNANNPNRISSQNYRYTMPVHPKPNETPTILGAQPFGIAVNGVLFDPGTAEFWHNNRQSGWHYDALGGGFSLGLDESHAHVQPNGAYHYHGIPSALVQRLSDGTSKLILLGWAADGFPIYGQWGYDQPNDPKSLVRVLKSSYQIKSGVRPSSEDQPGGSYNGVFVEDFNYVAGSGDLDECSGRFGVTPEFPDGTYHYVLTDDFPFVPRSFRGTPDPSFARRGPPPGGGPRGSPKERPLR